jgi:hypothetical protein
VTGARIHTPAPSEHLNQAALIGVRYCRFEPTLSPRRVRITAIFDLQLRDEVLPTGRVRIGIQPSLQQDL